MRPTAASHDFQFGGCRFVLKAWGIFEVEGQGPHVAPCDAQGYLEEPHQLDFDCPCKPEFSDGVCAHNLFAVEHSS